MGAIAPGVDRLRAWTYHRQRLGRGAASALAALGDIVGVYSSHPTGPLALGARTTALDAAAFAALEERREAVRIVGMRGSVFLVPTATADRIVAATRRAVPWSPADLRARGLDEGTLAVLQPRILEATTSPVTPTQLREALGVAPGDQRPYFAMRLMARQGLVLRVGTGRVRIDDLRWVSTEAWLGRPLGDTEPGPALAWLAGAYLGGYGPAREVDFAWWAGVPVRTARAALATIPTLEVGPGLLLPVSQAAAWDAAPAIDADAIEVLPKWDPYTMGHAPDGRARLVDDANLDLAFTTGATKVGATSGDGLPLVLRGGRAVATWTHRLDGRRMAVRVRPFPAGPRGRSGLLELVRPAFAPIGELFGAEVSVGLDEPAAGIER